MTLHRIDVRDCPAQPWRNGGGLTRELLAWPAAGDWLLRVSVARIDRPGPFSVFPGVRRCFAVLHGDGVRLDLPQGEVTLTADDEALAFDGEAAPMCHLLAGASEDLNLMACRDAGTARLQRARVGSTIDRSTHWRGLFAVDGTQLDIGDHTEALTAGTLAWSDDADVAPWRLRAGTGGWWLTLEA